MLHPQTGLFFMACRNLFKQLPPNSELLVSAYEIYRGHLYDILNDRKRVVACEQADGSVKILGLTQVGAVKFDRVYEIVNAGLDNRSTGSTGANEKSSRSHAIIQLSVKSSKSGKFTFIDLAGSERGADRADMGGKETRLEGAEINKSLLALKECIRALDQDSSHLPFRQSKLTQVLKDSFVGGQCQTCMIATVCPTPINFEHSLNTLRYADRVKELQSGGSTSSSMTMSHSSKLRLDTNEVNDIIQLGDLDDDDVTNLTPKIKAASSNKSTPKAKPHSDIIDRPMECMAILHDIAEMVSSCSSLDLQEIIHDELNALKLALLGLPGMNKDF